VTSSISTQHRKEQSNIFWNGRKVCTSIQHMVNAVTKRQTENRNGFMRDMRFGDSCNEMVYICWLLWIGDFLLCFVLGFSNTVKMHFKLVIGATKMSYKCGIMFGVVALLVRMFCTCKGTSKGVIFIG